MDVLVTGGSGQVGGALAGLEWPAEIRLHAPPRTELDLADPRSVERVMSARPWAAVISCGAYTAVDKAESEVGAAWAVNALAPAIMAAACAKTRTPIVHVSTDYVFAGDKPGFYTEDDPIAPVSIYGASKQGGEQAIRTANPLHAVVRTAWVLSPHGRNFLTTMLRLAGDRDEVAVVSDQRGCPTFAADLAEALQAITLRLLREPEGATGTFHFVNGGEATWSELATAIFEGAARRGAPSARVRPITTAEYPTPARRPGNSRLSTEKIERVFAIRPRPWTAALDEALDERLKAAQG